MTEMHDGIVSGVERLGFKVPDIRIAHAHFDHIDGHALMQRRSGAQVMAMAGDAEALQSGHDTSALGAIGWEPVPVARRAMNPTPNVANEARVAARGDTCGKNRGPNTVAAAVP
jgi:glyoxylase-like metal-dependent hydrolase (beta-lactamase superfamily II)